MQMKIMNPLGDWSFISGSVGKNDDIYLPNKTKMESKSSKLRQENNQYTNNKYSWCTDNCKLTCKYKT